MTRKHFEVIARILSERRAELPTAGQDLIDEIAGDLAVVFKDLNPRFDTVRFIEATRKV